MFFVLHIYVKPDQLADNQPKNILHYEERTNFWAYDIMLIFFLVRNLKKWYCYYGNRLDPERDNFDVQKTREIFAYLNYWKCSAFVV